MGCYGRNFRCNCSHGAPLAALLDPGNVLYRGKTIEPEYSGHLIARAWQAGVATAAKTEPLPKLVWDNLYAGLNMSFNVIPSIMSVGLLGLVLAEYTPILTGLVMYFIHSSRFLELDRLLLLVKPRLFLFQRCSCLQY